MTADMRGALFSPMIDSFTAEDTESSLRVMVVGVGTLLDYGVTTLLTGESDLLVAGVAYRGDVDFILNLTELRPDVIVVCESDDFRATQITDLLSRYGVMPNGKVIVARSDSNELDIWERVTISHRNDLLAVISHTGRLK